MSVVETHHLRRMTGLQFLRGNDLCLEVAEGQIPKFCLSLVLFCSTKTFYTTLFIFYLLSHEQKFTERLLCAGHCWKLFVCVSCVFLVCSGCCNKHHNRMAYKQQTFISCSPGGGEAQITVLQTRCLARSCFLDSCLFDVPSPGRGRRMALGSLL